MIMKKNILFLLLITSLSFAGTGSIYSRFGVGEINSFISGRSVGMGNTGVALLGETYINYWNPAALANISRTLIDVNYLNKSYTSEDASGSSIIETGNINGIAVAFPIHTPKKIVLSLGILPFSSVGYEQQLSKPFAENTITQMYEGRGGLSSGQLSVSYAATQDLLMGLTTQYLFGAIYKDQTINFSSASYYGGSYNQTLSMGGVGFTFGGIYSGIDKALGLSDTKRMNLGATVFTGSSLNLDDETLRNFSSNQDTVTSNNKNIDLPFGFSLGLAYLRNNVVYAADIHFQNWANFTINGVHPAVIQNSFRLNAGMEFLPSTDFTDSFLEKLSYRFGGYYHRTNWKINGTSINEMFGTAGFGFPFSGDSRMNVGLEYGVRGTTSSLLIKDTIFRLTISLTASEMMFIQQPVE